METIVSDIGPVLDGRPLPPKERQAFYRAEAQARDDRERGIVPDREAEQEYWAKEQEKDAMRQTGSTI